MNATPELAHELAQQRSYLLRAARRRVGDDATAEDMVQETLLAAFTQAAAFEQRATLRTWLTAILQRRVADHFRREARSPLVFGADADDALPGDVGGAVAGVALERAEANEAREPRDLRDPQRLLELRQTMAQLARGLQSLPEAAQRLFTLREIEGLDNEAAAVALGLDAAQCAVLWHRTRGKLRARLLQ